mgnify:CR=1 FL=1
MLFRKIILHFKIHIAAINQNRDCEAVYGCILCFQLKCDFTISKIGKLRFSRNFCLCAALLKISVCAKERHIACLFLIVPEKYCANAVTGMIGNQNTIYVFPIRFFTRENMETTSCFDQIFSSFQFPVSAF